MTGLSHTFTSAAALFTHIHLAFALAAFVVYLSSAYLAGARWGLIVRALGASCTAWNAVVTYSAGVFVGNVTPIRTLGNDAVRIALIRMRTNASVKAATASVVYDRASELPAVGVILLIALPTLRPSLLVVAAVGVLAAVLGLVPFVRRAIAARVTKWHDAIVGVPVSRASVAAALACSMGVWLLDITRITLVAAAFGVFLTPSQAATLTSIRLVSGIAPIPGGVGVIEGTAIAGLVWLGIPLDTATAITILERAILFGCGTAIGGVCLTFLGGRRALEKRAQSAAVAVMAIACAGVAGLGL